MKQNLLKPLINCFCGKNKQNKTKMSDTAATESNNKLETMMVGMTQALPVTNSTETTTASKVENKPPIERRPRKIIIPEEKYDDQIVELLNKGTNLYKRNPFMTNLTCYRNTDCSVYCESQTQHMSVSLSGVYKVRSSLIYFPSPLVL